MAAAVTLTMGLPLLPAAMGTRTPAAVHPTAVTGAVTGVISAATRVATAEDILPVPIITLPATTGGIPGAALDTATPTGIKRTLHGLRNRPEKGSGPEF